MIQRRALQLISHLFALFRRREPVIASALVTPQHGRECAAKIAWRKALAGMRDFQTRSERRYLNETTSRIRSCRRAVILHHLRTALLLAIPIVSEVLTYVAWFLVAAVFSGFLLESDNFIYIVFCTAFVSVLVLLLLLVFRIGRAEAALMAEDLRLPITILTVRVFRFLSGSFAGYLAILAVVATFLFDDILFGFHFFFFGGEIPFIQTRFAQAASSFVFAVLARAIERQNRLMILEWVETGKWTPCTYDVE